MPGATTSRGTGIRAGSTMASSGAATSANPNPTVPCTSAPSATTNPARMIVGTPVGTTVTGARAPGSGRDLAVGVDREVLEPHQSRNIPRSTYCMIPPLR